MHALQQQNRTVSMMQKGLALVAILMIGWFSLMVYRPQIRRLAELQTAWETEHLSLKSNQTEAQRLPAVAREVESLRQKLDRFDKRLPKQEELGSFMKDVTNYQQQVNLKKMTWGRGEPRHTELFAELPLTLNFEGDYLSVMNFLRQTEDMPRLTRVRSMMLKSKDDRPGYVDVQLSMNIYYAE
jgi:type IV pilus assembly protein PilO